MLMTQNYKKLKLNFLLIFQKNYVKKISKVQQNEETSFNKILKY
jgi:hypothetical protein